MAATAALINRVRGVPWSDVEDEGLIPPPCVLVRVLAAIETDPAANHHRISSGFVISRRDINPANHGAAGEAEKVAGERKMKKQVNPNYVCRLWAGEGNSRPIIVLEGDQSPKTTCESHDWTTPGGYQSAKERSKQED